MSDWVSIDGEVMPADEGRVPIYDRGFLYGDSVFETMRTYGGQLHALQLHLDRLRLSASRIAMELGFSEERIRRDLIALLAKRPGEESYLRLIITRGDGEFGLAPDLAGAQRLVILARPLPERSESFWTHGVKAISLEEAGRGRGRRIAKTGNYLTNLLALDAARRAGAHEALRFDADDQLTEGSTSNVFMVHDGVLYTPDLAAGVLPGITRQQILECAHRLKIPVVEGPISRALLDQAAELMISSSLRELVAVVMLDDEPIGEGSPGPICRQLHAAYREQCVDRR
jgi:branched-chain amino acid aminotransferase